jgi:hypothetical protein
MCGRVGGAKPPPVNRQQNSKKKKKMGHVKKLKTFYTFFMQRIKVDEHIYLSFKYWLLIS